MNRLLLLLLLSVFPLTGLAIDQAAARKAATAKLQQIKVGMTRAQVEKILGIDTHQLAFLSGIVGKTRDETYILNEYFGIVIAYPWKGINIVHAPTDKVLQPPKLYDFERARREAETNK